MIERFQYTKTTHYYHYAHCACTVRVQITNDLYGFRIIFHQSFFWKVKIGDSYLLFATYLRWTIKSVELKAYFGVKTLLISNSIFHWNCLWLLLVSHRYKQTNNARKIWTQSENDNELDWWIHFVSSLRRPTSRLWLFLSIYQPTCTSNANKFNSVN